MKRKQIMRKILNFTILFICSISFGQDLNTSFFSDSNVETAFSQQLKFIAKNLKYKDLKEVTTAKDTDWQYNSNSQSLDFGFDRPEAWSSFLIKNTSIDSVYIIKIQQSRVDFVQLFGVDQNNKTIIYPAVSRNQLKSERAVEGLNYAFKIVQPKNRTWCFYLFSKRSFGDHAISISTVGVKKFSQLEFKSSSCITLICGMILLASIIALCMQVLSKNLVFISYSIYSIASVFVILADSGFAMANFGHYFNITFLQSMTPICFYFNVGFILLVNIKILEIKNNSNPVKFWLGAIPTFICIVFGTLLCFSKIDNQLRKSLIELSYYIVFYADFYIIYTLVVNKNKNKKIVVLYLIGFVFTIIVNTMVVMSNLKLIEIMNQDALIIYFSPLVEVLLILIGFGYYMNDVNSEKFFLQRNLNQIQGKLLTVQEEEMNRIGSDIHDELGSGLAILKNIARAQKNNYFFEELSVLFRKAKDISHNLATIDFEKYNLIIVIQESITRFRQNNTITIELSIKGKYKKLSSEAELTIYRIYCENMANILKHAQAKQIFIELLYQQDELVLIIDDDGIGFDIKKELKPSQMGLKNINLRAQFINANYDFDNHQNGTTFMISIPYANY
jgi:signal transduction histidine kinase